MGGARRFFFLRCGFGGRTVGSPMPFRYRVPSMDRMLERISDTGAAQSQPAGHALPSLLPPAATLASAEDHVSAALRCDPFTAQSEPSTVCRSNVVATKCINSPDYVIARRTAAFKALSAISATLGPLRARWKGRLAATSPARGINSPRFRF